jgi:hypothetical protein
MRILLCLTLLAAAFAAAHADVPGLIFYSGFDGATDRCGSGWALQLPEGMMVPGRFGNAYRMQRGRANLLTPNQAAAEGTGGFGAGPQVRLDTLPITRPPGFGGISGNCLQAVAQTPGVLWTLPPRDLQAQNPHRPTITFVLSAYVRADQPGATVRLSLRDALEERNWKQAIAQENKATLDKNPQAKVTEPFATVAQPGELVLSDKWQRVMALLEMDGRRKAQSLVGQLELVAGGTPAPRGLAAVCADNLQLEQAAVYPVTNTAPTSWLPGGRAQGPSWIDLPADDCDFTGQAGTLACWVRALPDECGGTRPMGPALAVGTGWFAPIWTVGGSMWYAGNGYASGFKKGRFPVARIEERLLEAGETPAPRGWHHLALVWDDGEAAGYLDGERVGRCDLDQGKLAYGTTIRLGGSFLERVPMSGDLDEVSLFDRRLGEEELRQLVERTTALGEDLPALRLQRPRRLAFLRSEAEATIPLRPEGASAVTIKAEAPAFGATASGKATRDKPLLLKIKPWLAAPGAYPLRIEVSGGGGPGVVVTDQIEIFEEPQGRFIIYGWGGTDDLEKIGLNAAVVGGAGAQRELLERGLWANSRIDIREAVPHPWSPQNRERAEPIARTTARQIMGNPNAWSCLVNSEVGDPPFPKAEDEPWFTQWMKQEIGLDAIPSHIARPPLHVPPQKENGPPPILTDAYAPYRFLTWWHERGMGYWLLNSRIVKWMREEGLQVAYYSDQPEAVAQFAEMDLIDYWGYPKSPQGFVARASHTYNYGRLLGKPVQLMPGTVYWDDGNGLWVTDDDGKRKVLCLSPDCLRERLWLSVAAPCSSIGLYGLGERKTEVYDKACDDVLAETYGLIQPVGTLVGGLPSEQAQVALLTHDGLDYTQNGVADNWIRHWVSRTASRCLAQARLPFDWIEDPHAEARWLKRYRAVVVPAAWCLPEKTHQALIEYAKAGGQVIADGALRADIPGARKLAIESQEYPPEQVEAELGGWARGAGRLIAGPSMWAQVTPLDEVFTYTRECGPARYLFIVNDRREPGPQYERWKVEFGVSDGKGPLRDRGLAQEVTVTVPAGCALYDVLRHEAIRAREDTRAHAPEGKQQFTVSLQPGAAAVIAALPQAIARVAVGVSAAMKPGTEGVLKVRVLDWSGRPIAGRQLVEVTVTSPASETLALRGAWRGVQRYTRVENGALDLPLRLPRTAAPGAWQVTVREWLSGMTVEREFRVEG